MKRSRKIGWIVFAAALAVAGWLAYRHFTPKDTAPVYRDVEVRRDSIHVIIQATAVVRPENRVQVKPSTGGRVEEVRVREGDAVTRGQIVALMSSTDRAALLDSARARGEQEVARWQDIYKATPLMAPLDGTVILRSVEPGQSISAQDVVIVIADRLIMEAQVDETDLARIRLGQSTLIGLDAYPDHIITGRVSHIAYEAKTQDNVTIYNVEIQPDRIPDFMRSGMTADITFQVESRTNILVIAAEAVRNEKGRRSVLVPAPEDPASPISRHIRTGITDGKMVEVVSGLAEGDKAVVRKLQAPGAVADAKKNPFMPTRVSPPRRGGGH